MFNLKIYHFLGVLPFFKVHTYNIRVAFTNHANYNCYGSSLQRSNYDTILLLFTLENIAKFSYTQIRSTFKYFSFFFNFFFTNSISLCHSQKAIKDPKPGPSEISKKKL